MSPQNSEQSFDRPPPRDTTSPAILPSSKSNSQKSNSVKFPATNMLSNLFAAVFLPTLLLAAPTARDTTCTPSSYTISNFSLNPTPPNQHVHFVFTSSFSDTSNIIDLATKGAVCDAAAGNDGNFPNEIACSTGRTNVEVGLRGPESSAKYQVIHFWTCGG